MALTSSSSNVIDFATGKASAVKNKARVFYAQPFSASMNLSGWAMFLLAVIVISVAWKMILAHILAGMD
jgi:hypothetical protein